MRRPILPASAVLASLILTVPALADEREACVHGAEPEVQVAACTALIESESLTGANLAIALNNRGAARDMLGEHAAAIEDFDRALEIEPDYASAHYNRGRAVDALGDHARAIEDYGRALELDPDFPDAYQNRGVSREALGEAEAAQQDWARAIEIAGPPRARWWQEYLKAKGHYAGAVDGLYGPGTASGLLSCARDPGC